MCGIGSWLFLLGFDGFGFFEDAACGGFAEAEDEGDVADAFALGLEVEGVLHPGCVLFCVFGLEVLGFAGVAYGLEVEEAVTWVYLADDYVIGVVAVFSGADLELLDVPETGVLGALADGEDTVEEVVELFGAGEVVLGDGVAHVALGGVGYDEQGPAVFLFEGHEFHHEEAGYVAFFGGVAEIGEVVYDDDTGFYGLCGGFDVGEEGVLVVVGTDGVRDYLGSEESFGEDVAGAGGRVVVAELELFVGELAVYVEDFLVAGYLVGHLDGEDGLAEVAVCEEAAYFSFVP